MNSVVSLLVFVTGSYSTAALRSDGQLSDQLACPSGESQSRMWNIRASRSGPLVRRISSVSLLMKHRQVRRLTRAVFRWRQYEVPSVEMVLASSCREL